MPLLQVRYGRENKEEEETDGVEFIEEGRVFRL
jgi:hypothetical protein